MRLYTRAFQVLVGAASIQISHRDERQSTRMLFVFGLSVSMLRSHSAFNLSEWSDPQPVGQPIPDFVDLAMTPEEKFRF
jgi:hypothetical protein